ncbi:hypothetical protein HON22_02805 [Candidatus Peregrinibacteria bacterium]|jgi:hypothetical protein|nr:hypothetical protein [Candidatus Peregrinibacteria bacterium]
MESIQRKLMIGSGGLDKNIVRVKIASFLEFNKRTMKKSNTEKFLSTIRKICVKGIQSKPLETMAEELNEIQDLRKESRLAVSDILKAVLSNDVFLIIESISLLEQRNGQMPPHILSVLIKIHNSVNQVLQDEIRCKAIQKLEAVTINIPLYQKAIQQLSQEKKQLEKQLGK